MRLGHNECSIEENVVFNVIVNTVAGVPPSPFQANKRLASPVIPGTLSVSHVHFFTASLA